MENDIETMGLSPGVACKTKHDQLEAFLAEQVDLYFKATQNMGKS